MLTVVAGDGCAKGSLRARAQYRGGLPAQDAGAAVREVGILVNKRPVIVPARRTGAAIKLLAHRSMTLLLCSQ